MKNVEKRNSLRKRIKSFLKSIRIKVRFSRTFIRISKYSLLFVIIFAFLFIISVGSYFFLSPRDNPQGKENIRLSTTMESGTGINLKCRWIYEDYGNGFIEMTVEFEKEEINENKIYIRIHPWFNKKLPENWMEKSYMELFYSMKEKEKTIFIEEDKDESGKYYFDVSESKDKELDVTIYIYIGEQFFPPEREIISYNRYIYFHAPHCNLEENAESHFVFSPEWKISYCLGENNNLVPTGSRNFNLKAESPDNITFFVILERNIDKIALRDTKIGIFLTLLFAGITFILSVYLYEKK